MTNETNRYGFLSSNLTATTKEGVSSAFVHEHVAAELETLMTRLGKAASFNPVNKEAMKIVEECHKRVSDVLVPPKANISGKSF